MGRGILLDYHSWRLKQKDARYTGFDAFSSYAIPLQDLKACLADQGTEVKFGDILIIRSGKTRTVAASLTSASESTL